ncbi:hypothetical protein BH11ACT3_BH11ACT3_18060 [soil metagenome]
MLGIIALSAVIVSAISFAVVDVSIANANGCVGTAVPCADRTIPVVAITFGLLGAFSLLASLVPALSWFTAAMQHARAEDHAIDGEGESDLDAGRLDALDERARVAAAHRGVTLRLAFEDDE